VRTAATPQSQAHPTPMAATITDFSRLVYHTMDRGFEPSPEESCKVHSFLL